MTQTTMYPGFVNSPATTLSSGIDDNDTTIPVTELGVFPAAPNIAVIGTDDTAETIHYTGKSAATGSGNLTGVTREWNKTSTYGAAKSWDSGTEISRNFTEYDHATFKTNLEALDIALLGTPTLTKLQDWISATQSGGRIYGGVITDGGSGTIDVSAMKGMIKIADFTQGVQVPTATKFFDFAGETGWGASGAGTTLTDNSINYIYLDYNAGTPKLLCTTSRSTIRYTDQFNIGRIFKNGSDIEVLTSGINLYNRTRLVHERWIDTFGGLSRANGIIVSVSAARKPSWDPGVLYAGSNKVPISAVDCAGAGTFTSLYYNPTSGLWVETASQTTFDYTKYNKTDTGTGLASIGTSKYGVHWVYVCPEGEMYVLYGKGSYSLAEAQAALVATPIPNYLTQWCLVAAKVIISQSGTVHSVTSAWSTQFPVQIAGNHPDLGLLDYASAGHTGFAPTASPTFTGTPALTDTPTYGDNSHKLADTAFVQANKAGNIDGGTATSTYGGLAVIDAGGAS